MADMTEPKPVEGWATERRIGRFDLDALEEMAQRQRERAEAEADMRRRKALVALALLSVGVVALLVGVTALLGWQWGVLASGMMFIAMGIVLGTERSPSTSEKGK